MNNNFQDPSSSNADLNSKSDTSYKSPEFEKKMKLKQKKGYISIIDKNNLFY